MRSSPILDALFPSTRRAILSALLVQPEREWYLTELAKFLRTQPSSLQREIETLSKAGILSTRRDASRLYFRPDPDSPIFNDLRSLFEKTAGLIPILRNELAPVGNRVRTAFVYGSVARSQEQSGSDIDLMLIGDIGLADILPALRRAERRLGRPVNPTVFSSSEFASKLRKRDHFISTVIAGAKSFVKGSEDELVATAGPS